ncbi:MAG TPA: putative metal-binding motif-containing protein [Myxococcota bacterium]|nr:putative metal-binding motif-containing protein [Myxococcota bacterium]
MPLTLKTLPSADDDDGDGFGALDCDDTDASVFPGADEAPDWLDNDCDGDDDCDGLVDDACVGEVSTSIVGDLRLSQTTIESGQSLTLSVWLDGPGQLLFTLPEGETMESDYATWTAPAVEEPTSFVVAVEVYQDGERTDFRTGELGVWPPDTLAVAEPELVEVPSGCSTSRGPAGTVLVIAGLLLVVRNRRCSSHCSPATAPRPS